jgi:uncharacterized integral membrane protein
MRKWIEADAAPLISSARNTKTINVINVDFIFLLLLFFIDNVAYIKYR